jgi:hypothetical protein
MTCSAWTLAGRFTFFHRQNAALGKVDPVVMPIHERDLHVDRQDLLVAVDSCPGPGFSTRP